MPPPEFGVKTPLHRLALMGLNSLAPGAELKVKIVGRKKAWKGSTRQISGLKASQKKMWVNHHLFWSEKRFFSKKPFFWNVKFFQKNTFNFGKRHSKITSVLSKKTKLKK